MTFLNKIDNHKNKIAIIDNEKIYSYKKLISDSNIFTKNIKKRSLVFILAGNNYETVSSYVGLIRSKSVVVILDKDLNYSFLIKLIKKYTPNHIILSNKMAALPGYKFDSSFLNYKILKSVKEFKIKIHKDLAILLTTSGTTGSQKFVRQSYQNYKDNSKKIIKSINLKDSSSVITTLPISYTYGLSIINTHLISGSKIILNNFSILQPNFWKLYVKYKPVCFYGVPFTFQILQKFGLEKIKNKNLKVIGNAGGKIDNEIFSKLSKFSKNSKIKFFSMYGQTEATARMSILDPHFSNSKIGSIGKPLNGGKFLLIDEKNKIIKKDNVPGDLIYKGKNVSLGYSKTWNDLSKGNINKNRINTGDIAIFDKDGFYFIVGRKKRIIKIFGNRISLDEVEAIINKMGFKVSCEGIDGKILINYIDKNFNKEYVKNSLSKLIRLNPNYIKLEYVKKLIINKNSKNYS